MVQGLSSTALEALRDASASIDQQIEVLCQLKNDIVGHQQRKELVVRQAAVEPLVRIVSTTSAETGQGEAWTQEDEARLQATLVLGSLAAGGTTLMPPLLAADVPECLLSTLHLRKHRKQLTATLQAMRSLAEQSRTNMRTDDPHRAHLIDHRSLSVFQTILYGRPIQPQWSMWLRLITDIITASAVDEDVKRKIFESELWKTLLYLYARDNISRTPPDMYEDYYETIRPQDFAKLVSAIATVVEGSDYRAHQFMWEQQIRWQAFECPVTPQPEIPVPPLKSVNFGTTTSQSFPALGALQATSGRRSFYPKEGVTAPIDLLYQHTVCMELISLIKLLPASDRLPTLRLLASLNNALLAQGAIDPSNTEANFQARVRERYIAMCAVPVAVRLVQTACEKTGLDEMSMTEQHAHRELKPEACSALAALIRDSKELQVAAVDSGAIKRICPILKKSFDTVTSTKPMWSSRAASSGSDEDVPASCRIGDRGMPAELDYAMRCRCGALEAIAAITNREDIHRQAIVQAGVVQCIIDSLKPFTPEALERMGKPGQQVSPKDGNTTKVIIAACNAAKSVSRSVSLLRTSLIDAGIAKPILDSLKHPLLEVRLAATDVCCNLVLEFSPMREDMLNAGVVKTLAEHARQSEVSLRLSSLWALKHLVLASPRDIKVQTLEELGVGWLVAAIQDTPSSDLAEAHGGGVTLNQTGGLSAPNAAGERVDLLNPSSMDIDDPSTNSRDDDDEEDGELMYDKASATHYRASNLRSTLGRSSGRPGRDKVHSIDSYLESIRNLEQDVELRAFWDEINVQEQCLDIIRNLLTSPDDCAYMFEHLLNQIGTKQVFALLTEKLSPMSTVTRDPAARPSHPHTRPVHHPTQLILATVHILTHMAAGPPAQKQLLIAQKPLLQAWLPHFNHPDRRVRCVSVWAVNSLTWIEDESDRGVARERLRVLREVGIVGAVEALRGDGDLDVRERVRTSVRQFEQLS